jgi:thiamine-monophosphate kinase
VGGDTVRTSGPLVVNVALLGEADPGRLLRRDGAEPDDLLVLTGCVGASAAGLALLLEGGDRPALPEAARLLAAHHRPSPRLAAGRTLASMGIRCAIDVSDGVASESWHLARASGVAIALEVNKLPLDAAAVALFGEGSARQMALTGGEDYELLFTVPPARLAEVRAALADQGGATVVGRVVGRSTGGDVEFVESGRVVKPGQPGYVAF